MIYFTKHAEEKFLLLKRHNFVIARQQVITAVLAPELVDGYSRFPLLIAQKQIDSVHVLRVIYRIEGGNVVIITFYPGRIKQYEKTL